MDRIGHGTRRPFALGWALSLALLGCNAITDFDRFHQGDVPMDGATTQDGGTGDAGGGADASCETPVDEICNGADDDCDGMTDEGFDLDTDPDHCGECGMRCLAGNNAAPTCTGGACTITCDPGFGDCDGDPSDCETSLTTADDCGRCDATCGQLMLCDTTSDPPACASSCVGLTVCDTEAGLICVDVSSDPLHCGGCDNACDEAPLNATETCGPSPDLCGWECDAGWDNCNGDPATGCETFVMTLSDCGSCGNACVFDNANAGCNAGTCEMGSCIGNFDDCDGDSTNGCEADLGSVDTCGNCTTACAELDNTSRTCDETMGCLYACVPGFEDCNGDLGMVGSNGCETDLSDPATCGDCTTTCPAGMPLCSDNGDGTFSCQSSCVSPTTDCGGSCVNTQTNPDHCSGCGIACPPRTNATRTCTAGSCGYACQPNFASCDSNDTNGCETTLGTVSNCTGCGDACQFDHAGALCGASGCQMGACDPGYDDCSGGPADGCETALNTVSDCGSCGNMCPGQHGTPVCSNGMCAITCDMGFRDCDNSIATGCEEQLQRWYPDGDGDGFGRGSGALRCAQAAMADGDAPQGGDCDDTNANVNPGAPERCNGSDENCNGSIDEGFAVGAPCPACDVGGLGGTLVCSPDGSGTVCERPQEICNRRDDTCIDGFADESLLYAEPPGQSESGGDGVQAGLRLAWAPELEHFGMAWVVGGEILVATADPNGNPAVPTFGLGGGGEASVDLAWSGEFWVVVAAYGAGISGRELHAWAMDPDGGLVDDVVLQSGSLPGDTTGPRGVRITRIGNGELGIVWYENRNTVIINAMDVVAAARIAPGAGFVTEPRVLESSFDALGPVVTTWTERDFFAVAWRVDGSVEKSLHYAYTNTLNDVPPQVFLPDAAQETPTGLAYDPVNALVALTYVRRLSTITSGWMMLNPDGSVAPGGGHQNLGSGGLFPAFADDRSFGLITKGNPATNTPPMVHRFRLPDRAPVPDPVPLEFGHFGPLVGMITGDNRFGIAYEAAPGVIEIRPIRCQDQGIALP